MRTMSTESASKMHIGIVWMWANDSILVKSVVVVISGPCRVQLMRINIYFNLFSDLYNC